MDEVGTRYLARLRDGREVYLAGERIASVADHPAFAGAAHSVARLYDEVLRDDSLAMRSPTSGARVSKTWLQPRNQAELADKRLALLRMAELSYGWMGRSPEHFACALAGMEMGLDVFRADNAERATSLEHYFRHLRDQDLYLSYVLVNPQADRSRSACEQADQLVAAIVDEDAQGITICGAKMLGTGTVLADELLIGNIAPLRPDETAQAFSAAVAVGTPGVKLLSRRSYAAAASSAFDYPLSSHFDENDALVYFDHVKIPWSRVFVHRSPEMARKQFHGTPAAAMMGWHGQIRLLVKLRFLLGLARRICEANGILGMAAVQERLGYLAAQTTMVEGLILAMEAAGESYGPYFVPSLQHLRAAHVLTQELYPQFALALRELAGGGLIMLPSDLLDFAHPEILALILKTQKSPAMDSIDRVRLFKLAWDAVGSEFGSRHTQYEMFYSGAAFVTRGHAFRSYPWEQATGLVDDAMRRLQPRPG
nr:4-hydroxyphenylacetate 3-hydroxylase N-terminal domain-containing protein [uncultured Roseateles sp.]